jgi:hypothetical protein
MPLRLPKLSLLSMRKSSRWKKLKSEFAPKPGACPAVIDSILTLYRAYQYMWDQKHFGKLAIKIE